MQVSKNTCDTHACSREIGQCKWTKCAQTSAYVHPVASMVTSSCILWIVLLPAICYCTLWVLFACLVAWFTISIHWRLPGHVDAAWHLCACWKKSTYNVFQDTPTPKIQACRPSRDPFYTCIVLEKQSMRLHKCLQKFAKSIACWALPWCPIQAMSEHVTEWACYDQETPNICFGTDWTIVSECSHLNPRQACLHQQWQPEPFSRRIIYWSWRGRQFESSRECDAHRCFIPQVNGCCPWTHKQGKHQLPNLHGDRQKNPWF